MKGKALTLPCAAVLLGLALTGCGQQSSQAEYIGIDAAKAIALESAGITEAAATFSTAGLDMQNGTYYYAVDFTANGLSYEYDIDAITGVIIDSKAPEMAAGLPVTGMDTPASSTPETSLVTTPATVPEAVTAATGQAGTTQTATGQTGTTQTATGQTGTTQTVTGQTGTTQTVTGQTGTATQTTAGVTEARAKEIALAHAGLTESQVTFIRSKLEFDDGRQCYEVEFYGTDYTEYDYSIDASTGEIVSYDYDAEGYAPPVSSSTAITADQAKEIALAKVPGATVNDIYEFELDRDDGRLEYEGSIYYSGMEYEFTIDGYSGAIRGWEVESYYH